MVEDKGQLNSFTHGYPVFPVSSVERLLSPSKVLGTLIKDQLTVCAGFISGPLFCSTGLHVCFMPIPYCFSYCSSVTYFKTKKYDASILFSCLLFNEFCQCFQITKEIYKLWCESQFFTSLKCLDLHTCCFSEYSLTIPFTLSTDIYGDTYYELAIVQRYWRDGSKKNR